MIFMLIQLSSSTLPDYSILGAGSVLAGSMSETFMLYAGVPANPVKSLDQNSKYFQRTEGFVY
jgi:hypothetical protein